MTVIAAAFGYALYLTSRAAVNWTPVYATNFPDPTVMNYGGQYYAFSTASGAHVPSAHSSDAINWTKGNDALPTLPSWSGTGSPWAPSVAYDAADRQFVMFYAEPDAQMSPSHRCIGKAVASSPAGPFTDSSSAPFFCQPNLGGTIDPAIFTDTNGANYLYVKNAGNSTGQPDSLWVQPLTSRFTVTGSVTQLIGISQGWEGNVIEGPGMVKLGGKYFLFYAGNSFNSSNYAIGYATCSSPTGPCSKNPGNPVLTTQGTMLGPGSPQFFTDNSGRTIMDFAAWRNTVGSARNLYEAVITLSGNQPVIAPLDTTTATPTPIPSRTPVPTRPPVGTTPTPIATHTPVPPGGGGGGNPSGGDSTPAPGSSTSNDEELDTSYLSNGQHLVRVTKDGKTTTELVTAHNKLNLYQTIRNKLFAAFIGHPLLMNLGMIALILLTVSVAVGGFIFWRRHRPTGLARW